MSERDIFIIALQEDDPAQRQAYLDEVCAGQPDLRTQVEKLLRLYQGAGSFLEKPAAELATTREVQGAAGQSASGERPGTLIGPYKLLQHIGEGGMGTVWMAQQTEPVKRLVAVKLIKAGLDSKQVVARFEAERQALALMDHPNIARVLDGGTASTGRPYFVMDLVKGVPITRYCDEHHLTPRQRLELFIPVCQAVQHAHQKGIIHRDLKPSNVLVALYDGKPVPKVIDFGVAKAAGQTLTDKTLVTGFGAIVGTPEYMSPEQAEVNQLDIDTRSDIYSLGVLLYELLAGSPPFSRKELEKAGMLEMLRVIREQEPSKPSTKLSTAEGLPTLAANRGTEPAKLTRLVRGELDWIVMKALEKDRNRRYETANGFAMDVQRYLADEPVQACPPSAGYRLRKFVRRNKAGLMAATLVVLALMTGTTVSTWQAVRATRAEALAQERFEAEKKAVAQTKEARKEAVANLQKAREAVDQMLTRVAEHRLAHIPQMRAVSRTLLEDALKFYQGFLEMQSTDPSIRAETGMAYFRTAEILRLLNLDAARAKECFAQAITLLEQAVADFPASVEYRHNLGRSLNGLGTYLRRERRKKESEQAYRRALHQYQQLGRIPLTPAQDRFRRQELAWTYLSMGAAGSDDAENAFREVIALCEALEAKYPDQSFHKLWIANASLFLTKLLTAKGELEEADKVFKKLRELDPGANPLSLNGLAWLFATWGQPKFRDPDRAVVLSKKAVELSPTDADYWTTLGAAQYRAGDWKAAIQALTKSMELRERGDSFNWFFMAMAHWRLGEKGKARDRYDRAVQWMDKNQLSDETLRSLRGEAAKLLAVDKKKG